MTRNEDIAKAMMEDVPRGVVSRYLKDQTPPQARWMDGDEILQSEAIHYDPLNPGGKILLGAIGNQLIGAEDNRHIMTIGGSRSGKSVTLVSNLMFYQGSVLCMDPKGELAQLTASHRARMGQKVYVLDPFQTIEGEAQEFRASFNPLKSLKPENRTIVEDATLITDALVVSNGQEKDPHWNESASNFIKGLILHVATSPFYGDQERHLGTVRSCILSAMTTEGEEDFYSLPRQVFKATAELRSQGHEKLANVIEGSIRGFYDKGQEELGSVLSSVHRHTEFLGYFSMQEILQGHDFDLEDLKRDPNGVSVYLVLPATKMNMCNRWLRLFVNQLLLAMERVKENPEIPVLACLDEFPVLGFMQQLQDATGLVASFGVKLWVFIQDWGQGKSLYGDRFESFAANSGILVAFGVVDVATTEYLSKRLGQTTIEQVGDVPQNNNNVELNLPHKTLHSYPLMTADEIGRSFARSDPYKRQLILWAGLHPMMMQRVEYFDEDCPVYEAIQIKQVNLNGKND